MQNDYRSSSHGLDINVIYYCQCTLNDFIQCHKQQAMYSPVSNILSRRDIVGGVVSLTNLPANNIPLLLKCAHG